MPKVSIIIPNYNHAPYLEQRIESVLNQTFNDFEVIILDDCSTDNSIGILNRYAQHPKVSMLLINEQNSGNTFKQWQKGIEAAKGEYIWIAESDDWADNTFLETLLSFTSPKVSIIYCDSHIIDSQGNIIGSFDQWFNELSKKKWRSNYTNTGKEEIQNFLYIKNTIPNASSTLIKKSSININVSQFTKLKYTGDWFFYTEILKSSEISFVNKKLNYFRRHNHSVLNSIKRGKTHLKLEEHLKIKENIKKTYEIRKSIVWKSNYFIYRLILNQCKSLNDFIKSIRLLVRYRHILY